MNYKEALKALKKVGYANAEGEPLLAGYSEFAKKGGYILIPPETIFESCKFVGVDGTALMKLAATDPFGIVEIVDKYREAHPEMFTDTYKLRKTK